MVLNTNTINKSILSVKALNLGKSEILSFGKGSVYFQSCPPGWLSGERVGLMTWWLRVRSPTFLSGVFSPLTSAEVVSGFVKKSCISTGVRKTENTYASPTAMI